jgi:hypothetical protein
MFANAEMGRNNYLKRAQFDGEHSSCQAHWTELRPCKTMNEQIITKLHHIVPRAHDVSESVRTGPVRFALSLKGSASGWPCRWTVLSSIPTKII